MYVRRAIRRFSSLFLLTLVFLSSLNLLIGTSSAQTGRGKTLANDDTVIVGNGSTSHENIVLNDTAQNPLDVMTFGDSQANVGTFPADGVTMGSFPAPGGGTLDVIVDVDGNLSVTANGTTGTGTVSIFYQVMISNGTTDIAEIVITFGDPPLAVDDTHVTGNAYLVAVDTIVNVGAGAGLLSNDTLGSPVASLVKWGGGDASNNVNRNPGSSRPFAGGQITVHADGSFTLLNPTTLGTFTFDYIIENAIGTSQATVEISVRAVPIAQDDSVNAYLAQTASFAAPFLFNDNGAGPDFLGTPPGTLVSYGGGSLGGAVTDNVAGATVAIPVLGGTLTVNADGSLVVDTPTVAGLFTFEYQLDNGAGTSAASVTISVLHTPVSQDDYFTVVLPNNLSGDVTADNGFGADDPGVPAFTSLTYGSGDLGGTVGSNSGGASASLAGGTLTINNDGSFTLNGATTIGTYTFEYQLANVFGPGTIATVTIEIIDLPVAQDDALSATINIINNYGSGTLFSDNGNGPDNLGTPTATLVSFGDGSFGGAVTDNAAGATVAIPVIGGVLTINADGSVVIANPTTPGIFTFEYRIENASGFSDAEVEVTIQAPPIAQGDFYTFLYNANVSASAGIGLFTDNGSGADYLGFPSGTLVSFGGGSLGGAVTDNVAGASAAIAGGTLTVNADGSWSLTGQPFAPGVHTFSYRIQNATGFSDATVTFTIQDPPVAHPDALTATVNIINSYGAGTLFADTGGGADHLGTPTATLVSFGGGSLGGTLTDNAAGATVAFAGGSLTVNANGSVVIANPTIAGIFTFLYRIENATGFSDAVVTVTIQAPPVAQADSYTFLLSVNQNISAGAGLFVNNGSGADTLGFPAGTLVSFGGGSLGGAVTDNTPGDAAGLAGGTLTVNADGSWSLSGAPFTPGTFTFNYRIQNATGFSDATVTFTIQDPPVAHPDALTATVNIINSYGAGTLFADTGGGADHLGTPAAFLVSFGGGDLGGSVTDNAAGATVAFAGGSLTVNANGSVVMANPTTAGVFTFLYRIQNASGFSDAVVTVTIQAPPVAQADSYTFLLSVNQNISAGAGLFVNNGNGGDTLGFPAGTLVSYGGGSLGGAVTDNVAGVSAAIAGGTLTVNADGSWSLTGQPFAPGVHTFSYRIQNATGFSDGMVTLTIS